MTGDAPALLALARLHLARLSKDGYLPLAQWQAIETALGAGPLPPDPHVAAGLRLATPDDPRGPHAACIGCGATLTAAILAHSTAPAGYCCAWCAAEQACPCHAGRGWSTAAEQTAAAAARQRRTGST